MNTNIYLKYENVNLKDSHFQMIVKKIYGAFHCQGIHISHGEWTKLGKQFHNCKINGQKNWPYHYTHNNTINNLKT